MLLSVDTLDNIGRFIAVLLIFILVLGMTYFSTRYIANFQKNKVSAANIKILETTQIAQNKYIQLISVGKKYFVIAVSKDNISLIGELSEQDIDFTCLNNMSAPSFKEIINLAKNRLNSKTSDLSEAVDASEVLVESKNGGLSEVFAESKNIDLSEISDKSESSGLSEENHLN